MTVEPEAINLQVVCRDSNRTGRDPSRSPRSKNLSFQVGDRQHACRPAFTSDSKRLQQILKTLLSNVFKFTPHGQVRMGVRWSGAAGGLIIRRSFGAARSIAMTVIR